ncbi:reverse transcriptase [Pseudoscourfieldia marina]
MARAWHTAMLALLIAGAGWVSADMMGRASTVNVMVLGLLGREAMAKAAAAPGCCWGLAYLAVLWVLWYTGSDCKKSKRQRWRSLSAAEGTTALVQLDGQAAVPSKPRAWVSARWKLSSRLTPVQREELASLLTAHKEAFAFSNAEIVGYKGEQGPFEIPLSDDGSTREKARRLSKREQEIVDEYYTELRDLDFIERADKKDPRYGRYGTNTTVAAKKDAETGLWTDARICQDSRKPNEKCLRDLREMHRADELLRSAAKRQYFSTIDLRKGFHQIPVKEEHRIHTSFWWKGELWVWRVMSFGWRNASAKFQTVMDAELEKHGLTPDEVSCYIDDLLIHTATYEEHVEAVRKVLVMLESSGLRAHPSKCRFGNDHMEFLGHKVGGKGISPEEAKVAAIKEMGEPENAKELRSQMGLFSYYRHFLPNMSAISEPLRKLLKKDVEWEWGEAQRTAMRQLKYLLSEPGVGLHHVDPDRPIYVHTDWSNYGMGACLGQIGDDGREYMCACISRSLNDAESRYPSFYGELMCVLWAMRQFHLYVHGAKETYVVTDHQPLSWLNDNKATKSSHHLRWALALSEYDFKVIHRPGVTHQNADALSRSPLGSKEDDTGARLDKEGAKGGWTSQVQLASPEEYQVFYDAWRKAQGEDEPASTARAFLALTTRQGKSAQHAMAYAAVAGDEPWQGVDYTDMASQHASTAEQLRDWWARIATVDWIEWRQPESRSSWSKPPQPGWDKHGVVVVEAGGGTCVGLEAAMQAGCMVKAYVLVNANPVARAIAARRVDELRMAHGAKLGEAHGIAEHLDALSGSRHWHFTMEQVRSSWPQAGCLATIGWPGGDEETPAGEEDAPEALEQGLQRMLKQLGERWPGCMAYMVWSRAWQLQQVSRQGAKLYQGIVSEWGRPTVLNSTSVCKGRSLTTTWNIWQNLGETGVLQGVMDAHAKESHDAKRDEQATGTQDVKAEVKTLESRKGLKAGSTAGWLVEEARQLSEEERETALHNTLSASDANMALGISMLIGKHCNKECMQREEVTDVTGMIAASKGGRDMNNLAALMADRDANEWWKGKYVRSTADTKEREGRLEQEQHLKEASKAWWECYRHPADKRGIGCAAEASEGAEMNGFSQGLAMASIEWSQGRTDIHEDAHAMEYLRQGSHANLPATEALARARRRCKAYRMRMDKDKEVVERCITDGSWRVVPKPSERAELVRRAHEDTGHFGVRRTAGMLARQYYWQGMVGQVERHIRQCAACARAKARPQRGAVLEGQKLQPLPIRGLFYRWQVDLAGPFQTTSRGNKYIMVMIEAFSKALIVVPLPNKEASTTSQVFLLHVLSQYGACAEVVTDNGSEFKGEFDELLERALIDHRWTSRGHPQADGLAERAVQTMKSALRRCMEKEQQKEWDELVPWITMGYNASVQASTKLTPYELLLGREPVIPPAVVGRMSELDLEREAEGLADAMLQRALLMREHCAVAGGNLRIAQHRDSLRYAAARYGAYRPKLRKYEEGDYVYVSKEARSTLEPHVARVILRVQGKGRAEGTYRLMGADGAQVTEHERNMAPCHLQMKEGTTEPGAPRCSTCGGSHAPHQMLRCGGCEQRWHLACLPDLPGAWMERRWLCKACIAKGVRWQDWEGKQSNAAEDDEGYVAPPTSAAQQHEAELQQLHGRQVEKVFRQPSSGRRKRYKGEVVFMPKAHPPYRFRILWEDGDSETMTEKEVRSHLRGANATALLALAAQAQEMAAEWRQPSGNREELAVLMHALTPGVSARQVTLTAAVLPGGSDYQEDMESVGTSAMDIHLLFQYFKLEEVQWALDPFAGCGSIQQVASNWGCRVVGNDLNPRHAATLQQDATQVGFWNDFDEMGGVPAVITSCWFRLLDLLAPLVCARVTDVACLHVPPLWVTSTTEARQRWLNDLAEADRMILVTGLPVGPLGKRCAWLVVTKSPGRWRELVRHATTQTASWMALPVLRKAAADVMGGRVERS